MTQPPTWGTPPPPQQPGGWPNQPVPGRPGQPAQGGQWALQQSWTTPAPVPTPAPIPPNKGGIGKWVIGAVALVAVIAVTAVITVNLTKNGAGGGPRGDASPAPPVPSDVASANDKGPVGIITEDPSCKPWAPVNDTLYDIENKGWLQRDPKVPASSWTPEVRAQYEAVAKGMRAAADQAVPLAKMTTHRVMRELYSQFIAYSRAYVDSINRYVPVDDNLARAASTAANTVTSVCAAISFDSAAARAALVPAPPPPTSIAPIGDLYNPQRMFMTPDSVCPDFGATLDLLLENPEFKKWLNTDPQIAVGNWTPEVQAMNNAVSPIMTATADALTKLAAKSSNPIVQDFIMLGVQYRRTYVQAMPTYRPSDHHIYSAGQRAPGAIMGACDYVAG